MEFSYWSKKMNTTPLVSVLIPTYNIIIEIDEKFIQLFTFGFSIKIRRKKYV